MVPSIIRPFVMEPTGELRVRLEKRWFGYRTVFEREHFVEYHTEFPGISMPVRVEREWFRESPWKALNRNFYISQPWQPDE